MNRAIDEYLDRVMAFANRKPEEAPAVRAELRDHLLEKVAALKATGAPPEDAVFGALKEMGNPRVVGYGLRPRFPFLDVRAKGTARGFIALGPKAVGVFAFGGMAVGVFSLGGLSVGIFSVGGLGLGLLFAWAGLALAPLGLAYGGIAIGLAAAGGIAVGIVSAGAMALGVWVPQAGAAFSRHPVGEAPQAVARLCQFWDNPARFWTTYVSLIVLVAVASVLGGVLQAREGRRTRDPRSVFAE